MKKVIAIASLLLMLVGCVSSHRVVGDEYVVHSVEKYPYGTYKTENRVILHSLNTHSAYLTWNGNSLVWYTNQTPQLGDTVRVVIK